MGEALTVEHTPSTGTYTLTDGTGVTLTGCAVVVTVNATELRSAHEETAQAAVTGEHTITVMTYEAAPAPPTTRSR